MVKTRSQAGRIAYYKPRNHAARGTLSNRKKHRIIRNMPGILANLLPEYLEDPDYIHDDNLLLDCQEQQYFNSRVSNDNPCYRKGQNACDGPCRWVIKGNQGYCRRRDQSDVLGRCRQKLARVLFA